MKTTLILTLLLASSATGQTTPEPVPQAISRYEQVLLRRPDSGAVFERVLNYYQTGPGTEALITRWTEAYETTEDSTHRAGWATLLGTFYQKQGKTAEAADWFTQALEVDPAQTQTRITLGEMLANAGDFEDALTVLRGGIPSGDPASADPELVRQLALTLERNFQTEEAVTLWQSLANRPDADTFAMEEAAEALARNQDFVAARALYTKLREKEDADPYQKVRYSIRTARLWEAEGDFEKALEIYEQAIPQTSGTSWIQKELRNRIEQVYRKQEDLPGLVTYYESLIESRGPDTATALLLADVLDDLGRSDEATEWILRATEWSPSRSDLSLLLADRYLDENDASSAIEVLAPLHRSDPQNEAIIETLGDAYWVRFESDDSAEDRDLAITTWEKIAPPSDATALNHLKLAGIFKSYDLSDKALAAYEMASEKDPDSIDIREQWADWLFTLERPDEAWAVLAEVTATPAQRTADRFLRLARIQKRYGNPDEAVDSVNRGLSLEPESFELLSLKWSILAQLERWEEAANLYGPLFAAAPNEFFRQSVDQRHIQALAASDQLEETLQTLQTRLGSDSLSIEEMALLLQIATTTRDVETTRRTLAESEERFPDSIRLRQLALNYHVSIGDYGQAIHNLEKLLELSPTRSDEWLQQIAANQQAQGDYEQAIRTAQRRVEMNPAKTKSQLDLANLYMISGEIDSAIETLLSSIALSEDKTAIRNQLIEYLSANGMSQEAYDEAWILFRESDSVEGKLRTLPTLTNIAVRQGLLDDLIRDFERKRLSEENGFRYALFLASIYESVGDLGRARSNLIEALAARPDDTVLIRQILEMAKKENDWEDYVRFSSRLAEIEPSVDNLFTHLEALLASQRHEEAVEWLAENQETFLQELKAVRLLVGSHKDAASEVLNLFGQSLRHKDGDAESQIALAELLLVVEDFEGAEEAFWRVLTMNEPAAAQQNPIPSVTVTRPTHWYHGSGIGRRIMMSNQARNQAQQMILQSGNRHHHRSNQNMASPSFEELQDRALIYLAALAVRDEETDSFLAELEETLDQRADPIRERMITFAILNEAELAQEAAKTLLAQDGLDRVTLQEIQGTVLLNPYSHFSNRNPASEEQIDQTLETINTLKSKWEAIDPQMAKQLDFYALNFLLRAQKQERARELAEALLVDFEPETPGEYQVGLTAIVVTGDYTRLSEWIKKFLADSSIQQGLGQRNRQMISAFLYNPMISRGYLMGIEKPDPESTANVVLENLKIYWDQATFPKLLPGSQPNYGRSGQGLSFPAENRWVAGMELYYLRQIAQSLQASPEMAEIFVPGLEKIFSEMEGEKSIAPGLTLAILYQYRGQPEKAAEIAQNLSATFPQYSELRFSAAIALSLAGDHEAALAEVAQTRALTYPEEKIRLMVQLQSLVNLERRDEAEAAAKEFFTSRRLSQRDHELRNLLNQLNLNAQTRPQPTASRNTSSISRALRSNNWNDVNSVIEQMRNLDREKKHEESRKIAEMILSSDPTRVTRNNESYIRDRALDMFDQEEEILQLKATLEEQLEAAPGSAFLHFRLAELGLKAKSRNKGEFDFRLHVDEMIRLRPDDTDLQLLLANRIMSAGDHELAVDLYALALENDPAATIQSNSHNLVRAYMRAERMDELLASAEDPEFIRKVTMGNSWGLSNFLQQVGNQLENDDRPVEALEFRLIGLDYLDWNNRLSQIFPILDLQLQLDRIEEARETIWTAIFETSEPETESRFGFNANRSGNPVLFSQIHYYNSQPQLQGVRLLDYVQRIGLEDRLLEWIEDDDSSWLNEYDSTLSRIFIRISQQDPTLLTEFEENTGDAQFIRNPHSYLFGNGITVATSIGDRLSLWEDAQPFAFEVLTLTLSSGFTSISPFQNNQFLNLSIQNAIKLLSLAETDEEMKAAGAAVDQALESLQIAFVSPNQGNLNRETVVAFFVEVTKRDLLSEEDQERWIDQIRNASNWGDSATTAANYLSFLANPPERSELFPVFDEDLSLQTLNRVSIDPESTNRSRSPLYTVAEPPADLSGAILYVTPAPAQSPISIPADSPDFPELFRSALPNQFGYALLAGPGEDLSQFDRDSWAPISLLPNLLSQPNPADAMTTSESTETGWDRIPAGRIATVTFPENSPIRTGTRVVDEHSTNRGVFLSDPIPIEGDSDLLVSGWFEGTDSQGNEGYAAFGLAFLNKEKQQIRLYTNSAQIPYDDLWTHVSSLYTAPGSARAGRTGYPKDASYIQVRVDIEAGITFGGLYFTKLPPVSDQNSLDVGKTMNEAVKLAREGEQPEKVADLFLTALAVNPNRAFRYYRENDDYWAEALEESGRLGEIFEFVGRPDVHDRESFRYYRKNINSQADMIAIGKLAIQNADTPNAQVLLDTIISGKTLLTREQVARLQLAATAAGLYEFSPEELLDLAQQSLALKKFSDGRTASLNLDSWSDVLGYAEQLGLLESLEESIDPTKSASREQEVNALLIRAWIAAANRPEETGQILEGLADKHSLNDLQIEQVAVILGRMASSEAGITPAQDAIEALSQSVSSDPARQARFRVEALSQLETSTSEASEDLKSLLREAELDWLILDAKSNRNEVLKLLAELVAEEDFSTANSLFDAASKHSSFRQYLLPYYGVFPRLAEPENEVLSPVAITGAPVTDGSRSIFIQMHPQKGFSEEHPFGGPARITLAPVLESIPGLVKMEIQFGDFPTQMETISILEGDQASAELRLMLPSKNGLLRAVAHFEGSTLPGPITPLYSGELIELGHGLSESDTPTIDKPTAEALSPTEKRHRFDADLTPLAPDAEDLLFAGWARSEARAQTVNIYPSYQERDSNLPLRAIIDLAELTLITAVFPGEAGEHALRNMSRLDIRIPSDTEFSGVQLVRVNREEFPYLRWMREMRHLSARIKHEDEITTERIFEVANRDPYGSAVYLLEEIVSRFLLQDEPEAAAQYIADLDPTIASPFHRTQNYQSDLQRVFTEIADSNKIPSNIQWEAAVANLGNGSIDPLGKIELLYQVAGDDPERLTFARQQMIDWLEGSGDPLPLANYNLVRAATRFSRAHTAISNPLHEFLRLDYDEEIDVILRRRFQEAEFNVESDPIKAFLYACLLPETYSDENLAQMLDESLNASGSKYTKAFSIATAIQNLDAAGYSAETQQELLLTAIHRMTEEPAERNESDPPRPVIILLGELLRGEIPPPSQAVVDATSWIIQSASLPKASAYLLASENTFLLLEFLQEQGYTEEHDALLKAIQAKAMGSRYEQKLTSRYPELK